MKVSSTQQKFTPFSITIDIESEGEARALYAIFNHYSNDSLLGSKNARAIKTTIGTEFSLELQGQEINNGINGHKFYQSREN